MKTGKIYKEIYTADDEEPMCGRCDHFADNFDCSGLCGSEHAWNGYKRVEITEESEEANHE